MPRIIGHLWVRRAKSGRTFFVGYLWHKTMRERKRVVYAVKVGINKAKTDINAPDYLVHDFSGSKKIYKKKEEPCPGTSSNTT